MTLDEIEESFAEMLTVQAYGWRWSYVHCRTGNDVQREPVFFLQNLAPPTVKIFILKNAFTQSPAYSDVFSHQKEYYNHRDNYNQFGSSDATLELKQLISKLYRMVLI